MRGRARSGAAIAGADNEESVRLFSLLTEWLTPPLGRCETPRAHAEPPAPASPVVPLSEYRQNSRSLLSRGKRPVTWQHPVTGHCGDAATYPASPRGAKRRTPSRLRWCTCRREASCLALDGARHRAHNQERARLRGGLASLSLRRPQRLAPSSGCLSRFECRSARCTVDSMAVSRSGGSS